MRRWWGWLSRFLVSILAAGGGAYCIAAYLPAKLYEQRAPTAQIERTTHDPVGFAARLSETLPEGGKADKFAREVTAWLEENPPPVEEPPPSWRPVQLLSQAALSYFLCFAALFFSGFFVILLSVYLALPAPPWRKSALLISFLLLTGIPAALLAWWPLAPLFQSIEPPLVHQFLGVFGEKASPGLITFLRAELTVLIAMVLCDGLAGTLLLRAQTLTADERFTAFVASRWAGLYLKSPLLPLPGTLSLAIVRELRVRVFPSWSGMLGRFLVTEIILELVLHLLTPLDPQGIGFYIFYLLENRASPWAYAATAAVLMAPLALSRPPARRGDDF